LSFFILFFFYLSRQNRNFKLHNQRVTDGESTDDQRVTNGKATVKQRVIKRGSKTYSLAIGIAITVDYTLTRSLELCNKLDELLKKAISNSKTSLVFNELQEAIDYFKKAEKNLYMAVDLQYDCGIKQHIKPINI